MRLKATGIVFSIVVSLILWNIELPGNLSPAGQKALVVIVFTVIWWIFNVIHPAYTTLLMFLGYIFFDLATPEIIFKFTTLPLMWLVFGAFLIARAATKSGLADRVAYFFMLRFAHSYSSIIVSTYVLNFILSFLIPQPFPRVLLIMALVSRVIEKSGASQKDAASLGLSVFISATPTSMILLTGDAMLNVAAVAFSGVRVGWLDWAVYMAIPGFFASLLMLGLHLTVFRQNAPLQIDIDVLRSEQRKLGPLTRDEKVTVFWLTAALILWTTDFIHHVDPSWIALIIVIGLAMPKIGDILDVDDINTGVSWPIVIFVIGALAIGTVGRETGLSDWLARTALPANPPENIFLFALMVVISVMVVHMILGSALACMSIVSPPLVQYAISAGLNPIVPALLVYTAVEIHYLLAYQHIVILVGKGDVGGFEDTEVMRYGVPLTFVTLAVVLLVELPWWKLIGLI